MAEISAEEQARKIRKLEILTVALCATGAAAGDLGTACNLAETAIATAITEAVEAEHDKHTEREEAFARTLKFLQAYATGRALTFVDPNTGKLVTANSEARALANACLEGPAAIEARAEKPVAADGEKR